VLTSSIIVLTSSIIVLTSNIIVLDAGLALRFVPWQVRVVHTVEFEGFVDPRVT